jgi:hypothetical protein
MAEFGEDMNWCQVAAEELAKNLNKKTILPLTDRTFRSIFGLDPITTKWVYNIYLSDHESLYHPKYLLWTLSWLKNYETEPNSSIKFANCNQTYFRENVWAVIHFLSDEMDEVSLFFNFLIF